MISRRPHKLIYKFIPEPQQPYQDDNGTLIYPDNVEVAGEVLCRVEPEKSSNPFKVSTNGGEYDYQFLIFSDKIVYDGKVIALQKGIDEVEVIDIKSGELLAKGTVVDFANDQRQCRIWL